MNSVTSAVNRLATVLPLKKELVFTWRGASGAFACTPNASTLLMLVTTTGSAKKLTMLSTTMPPMSGRPANFSAFAFIAASRLK